MKHKLLLTLAYVLFTLFFSSNLAFSCTNLTPNFSVSIAAGCNYPRLLTITNSSTGSLAAGSSYIWKLNGVRFDSTNGLGPVANYLIPGPGLYVFKVIARTAGNCYDSTKTVTLSLSGSTPKIYNQNSVATFTPSWTNCIINPLAPSFFYIEISSPDTLKNYRIIWGDGMPDNSGLQLIPPSTIAHTYNTLGIFTPKIIVNNGSCYDTVYGSVMNLRPVSTSIRPLPAGQLAGCAPHAITFMDSTQNAFPGTILTWNFGDGTIITRNWTQANTPISHVYQKQAVANCIFTVSLSAFNPNCNTGNNSTYSISPILIFDVDVANIGIPATLCNLARTYTLTNTSVNNCITGQRLYYWDFGDGTNTGWIMSKGSQTHTFPDFGTYTIMLIDSNACGSDTIFKTIIANQPPQPKLLTSNKFGCAPLTVTLTDTSTIGSGITRSWTFTGTTPTTAGNVGTVTRTFNLAGTYIVTETASNVCQANVVARDTIRVYAKPIISVSGIQSGCVPLSFTPVNNSTRMSPNAKYLWTFGNGVQSILRNPGPVTYVNPGAYTIKLVITDTCGSDSMLFTVNAYGIPKSYFLSAPACHGDTSVFANASTIPTGDFISTYRWYFGNGDSSTSSSPLYIYPNAGNYSVRLLITTDKGCFDDSTSGVSIQTKPILSANATPSIICKNNTVLLQGTATTLIGTLQKVYWVVNGPGISDTLLYTDTSYKFTVIGDYQLRFEANNSIGCKNVLLRNISVKPLPIAKLTISNACVQSSILIKDSSSVLSGNSIDKWLWNIPSQTYTSVNQNTSYVFPTAGTYWIRLTVGTNYNCYSTDSSLVTVYPKPIAVVSFANSICKYDTLSILNSSSNGQTYTFNFGDGSPIINVLGNGTQKKAFDTVNTFTIQTIAISAQGCRDTTNSNVSVRDLPKAKFISVDSVACAPNVFSFVNQSTHASNYMWYVNSVFASTLANLPAQNITLSNQNSTIKLVALSPFGCRPDTLSKQVFTYPNPVAAFSNSIDSGCAPLTVTFLNNSIGASNFNWKLGGSGISITTSPTATFPGSQTMDSVFTIQLVSMNVYGCKDSIIHTVKTLPQPISAFTSNVLAGCAPLNVSFQSSSVHQYGGTFSNIGHYWRFGNGDTSSLANPTSAFIASKTIDTSYAIQLISSSKFGCKDTSTGTITVFANPLAQFSLNQVSGCTPLAVNFTNQSVPNGTGSIGGMSQIWTLSNGLNYFTRDVSSTFMAGVLRDSSYQIKLRVSNQLGCVDSITKSVLVHPSPIAQMAAPAIVCANDSFAITNSSSLGYTYQYLFSDSTNQVTTNSMQVVKRIFSNTGLQTYQMKVVSAFGCRDSFSRQVDVKPLPSANFSVNDTIACAPKTFSFINTSQNGSSFLWRVAGSLLGNAITLQDTTLWQASQNLPIQLLVTSIFGCRPDSIQKNIRTYANPTALFSSSKDSGCGPLPIVFTNQSSGNASNVWRIGSVQSSTLVNFSHEFLASQQNDSTYLASLIVTNSNGCKDSLTKNIHVFPKPSSIFTTPSLAACAPLSLQLSNQSIHNYGGGFSNLGFKWNFGSNDTSNLIAPSRVLLGSNSIDTNYIVTLIAQSRFGCLDTSQKTITVYARPKADFTPSLVEGCTPLAVSYFNQSLPNGSGNLLGMSYSWKLGNGATNTSSNAQANYVAGVLLDSTYSVQLIAMNENGCRDSVQKNILVHPQPLAQFSNTATICAEDSLVLQNQSILGNTFQWAFSDSIYTLNQTGIQSTKKVFTQSGVKGIHLVCTSVYGCRDTANGSVLVRALPRAQFSVNDTIGCVPVNFSFSNSSVNSASYLWRLNGSTISNATILADTLFTQSNIQVGIQLIAQSAFGCRPDTVNKTIYTFPKPSAAFVSTADSGCGPLQVIMLNQSLNQTQNLWSMGNGLQSQLVNPFAIYMPSAQNDSIYAVKLKVVNTHGCTDSTQKNIRVYPIPESKFVANTTEGCGPLAITFTNLSDHKYGGALADLHSVWYTDGIDSTLITHKSNVFYASSSIDTSYLIKLRVTSKFGCSDTSQKAITVYANPKANYVSDKQAGCGPLAVSFTNQSYSIGASTSAMAYQWKFGNGTISSVENSNSVFGSSQTKDTIYTIELLATNLHGCKDSIQHPIRVYPKPKALFTLSDTAGCSPLTVYLTNQSYPNDTGNIGIMNFFWSLGNGMNSSDVNPSSDYYQHVLADTNYHIRLVALSEHGCRDTLTKTAKVYPDPIAAYTQNKSVGCGPLDVVFSNTSQLGNQYVWQFGDGDTSTQMNPSHTFKSYPLVDSVYIVRLNVSSIHGCMGAPVISTIISRYSPMASFITSDDSICGGGSIAFYNNSLGGVNCAWTFGNGATSTLVNPIKTFVGLPTRDTSYAVKLVLKSPYGCKDSTTLPVKVMALPDARFTGAKNGCTPLDLSLQNNSLRAITYEWDFGDAELSDSVNEDKTYENILSLSNKSYTIILKAVSSSGCSDTAKAMVTVFPKPISNFTINKGFRCDSAEFKISNMTLGANNFNWKSNDKLISVPTSGRFCLPNKINSDSTYSIKLLATNSAGCKDSTHSNVLVKSRPIVDFDAAAKSNCSFLDASFVNNSVGSQNFFWLFGDGSGSTLANPTHRYFTSGDYKVSLVALDEDGCGDTLSKDNFIQVFPVPSANFIYSPNEISLPKAEVNFKNLSFLASGTMDYYWEFIDSKGKKSVDNVFEPSFEFKDTGNFQVKLFCTTLHNCKDSISRNLNVKSAPPEVGFTYDPPFGCAPLDVTFTNTCLYGTQYYWNFGDGATSVEVNPRHTYKYPGKYNVYLRVVGPGGMRELIKEQIIEVFPSPKAGFIANPYELVLPNSTISLFDISFDAVKWHWQIFQGMAIVFDDTLENTSHTFSSEGIYSVRLYVENTYGCSDQKEKLNIVTVTSGGRILVPNAFTPDANTVNDGFKPLISGEVKNDYVFRVFNRWGQLLFETNNPSEYWSGNYSGEPCQADVYVYTVEGSFTDGNKFASSGNVSLLR
ncbi:MAG: hypothetical protein CFE21_05870 [Bacteroidetes bacterium B1(2017)]|nr:MAG: hypothetical protein CFE21_05870 [Bacteroidetes bacterium B1(2017)]